MELERERPNANEREHWVELRREGWRDAWSRGNLGLFLFLLSTGLAIELLSFSVFNQHAVLTHTLLGLVFLPVFLVFNVRHVRAWWDFPMTHVKFTGWAATFVTAVCVVSGVVLTWQGAFGTAISYAWRTAHILSTWGALALVVPHVGTLVLRELRRREDLAPETRATWRAHLGIVAGITVAGIGVTAALCGLVRPVEFVNAFPADYDPEIAAGKGPFAPSLAMTSTGGAFDSRSLSDSKSCGAAGCHEQIYAEWLPSAHRYAALDQVFQGIQGLMASQNGPVSTRYCAGCHDPISLFSGTKFVGVENLTGLAGYQEGVSCLACHAIQQTDVKGNANYVVAQPERYVWELRDGAFAKFCADFLIRTYPERHVETLSRRMFKTPEFCAACHKQFIDETVNKVGWVQLQNQYDNWKASRWNHTGDPSKTLECRECHMPLIESSDPAAGDALDFNRVASDGKHRSHRFLGANQFIPVQQDLPGGKEHAELVERWLRGELEIPEIADRWSEGPAVPIELEAPPTARAGDTIALRVRLLNNKVGHDFPTGPLDIIQAWVELVVKDESGNVVLHSGERDADHFIETGTFMFKAEPVDRYGNLIDRHNLWEMVGVRFKRSLFPGAEDVASYEVACPSSAGERVPDLPATSDHELAVPSTSRELVIEARLNYRKVDQYLIRYAFGAGAKITAPVTEVARATARVRLEPALASAGGEQGGL
ncbi:MAG: hypothetical protein IT453_16045 [Planctomycetes bacterium]|nr:hypothetical protein [Planctomycetota bacterium]